MIRATVRKFAVQEDSHVGSARTRETPEHGERSKSPQRDESLTRRPLATQTATIATRPSWASQRAAATRRRWRSWDCYPPMQRTAAVPNPRPVRPQALRTKAREETGKRNRHIPSRKNIAISLRSSPRYPIWIEALPANWRPLSLQRRDRCLRPHQCTTSRRLQTIWTFRSSKTWRTLRYPYSLRPPNARD